jgi:tetratricopeptide (TPR) repeat protein
MEATMYAAQAQLAEAYLEANRANEARVIAEDLVAREPWEPVNVERFRRALIMLGEPDPDSVIADRLSGESPFTSTDFTLDFSFNELARRPERLDASKAAGAAGQAGDAAYRPGPASIDLVGILGDEAKAADGTGSDTIEIDLSETFGELGDGEAPEAGLGAAVPAGLAGLERVFEGFREEAVRGGAQGADAQFRQALSLHEAGETENAVKILQQVVRLPRYRFRAAAELARISRDLGHASESIEWFERAAESAPAGTDESRDLLYDLGLLLMETGETERALAVFLELQADAPDYRDVTLQVGRLSQKA